MRNVQTWVVIWALLIIALAAWAHPPDKAPAGSALAAMSPDVQVVGAQVAALIVDDDISVVLLRGIPPLQAPQKYAEMSVLATRSTTTKWTLGTDNFASTGALTRDLILRSGGTILKCPNLTAAKQSA